MKYTVHIGEADSFADCMKRLDTQGDSKGYLVVRGSETLAHKTPDKPVGIAVDGTSADFNERMLFMALMESGALGDGFDGSIVSEEEIKAVKSLGGSLCGRIEGGSLHLSKYSGITDLSLVERLSGLNDIRGYDGSVYTGMFGMPNLKRVALPTSLASIGEGAFAFCVSLTDVRIPSSVKDIRDRAFYNCVSLKELVVPSSVRSLGRMVFDKCASLKRLTFTTLTPPSIADDTFHGVSDTLEIAVPSRLVRAYEDAWGGHGVRIISK